jgi:hypothetical protein
LFAATIGYRRANYQALIEQIKQGTLAFEAVPRGSTPYGDRFQVELRVNGPKGSAVVRTLWIYRAGEDVPRFTSAYPIR